GSGSPLPGDWGGIDASVGGSIDLGHAVVDFGGSVGGREVASWTAVNEVFKSDGGNAALNAQGAKVTVADDSFVSPSGSAAAVSSPQLQLTRNTASGVTVAEAYWADSLALDFGGLSANTAGHGGLAVSGGATTSTWSGSLPLLLLGGGSSGYFYASPKLDVPSGVTLTLAAGSLVKGLSSTSCVGSGCSMSVQGSLAALGTAAKTVTFTSINDNSVGGVTGSGSPLPGDWGGIDASVGGSIDMGHAVVDYGGSVGGKELASLTAVNDVFKSDGGNAALNAQGAKVTVADDSFVSPSGSAAAVSSPQLQLTRNTASGVTVAEAYWADSSAL